MINFKRTNISILKEGIDKFELNSKIKLPAEYRKFLLQYNGGYALEKDCFSFLNSDNGSDIQVFYGLNLPKEYNNSSNSLEQNSKNSGDRFPYKYLSIIFTPSTPPKSLI